MAQRQAGRHAVAPPRVLDPVHVAHWAPTLVAALVFAAVWLRIRQWWFIPSGRPQYGYTEWVVRSTVDGTAIAPNQYRFLMPWAAQILADGAGWSLPTAIVALDAALTAVLVVVLHRLVVRLDARPLIVLAALGWGFWSSKLDHWHPEVMLLAVFVTTAALLLLDPRPRCWSLLLIGLGTCGARTDYAAGLAVTLLAVGAHRRCWRIAVTGAATGLAAVAATRWLVGDLYPQARYIADVVQVPFNLAAGSWAMVFTFYGPALLLPAAVWLTRRELPPLWPLLLWFGVQFGAVFVVGRVEETRIFMPFSPVLCLVAALAYLALRREHTASGVPRADRGRSRTALAETTAPGETRSPSTVPTPTG